jgi:hypothetical protein
LILFIVRTIGYAPIINYEKKATKKIRVPIIIYTLGIVDKRSLVKDLPHVLKVKRKLQKNIMLNCYYMPESFI